MGCAGWWVTWAQHRPWTELLGTLFFTQESLWDIPGGMRAGHVLALHTEKELQLLALGRVKWQSRRGRSQPCMLTCELFPCDLNRTRTGGHGTVPITSGQSSVSLLYLLIMMVRWLGTVTDSCTCLAQVS